MAGPGDERVERGLTGLGGPAAPPPIGEALAGALAALRPARTRRPGRELAVVSLISLAAGAAVVAAIGVREDLAQAGASLAARLVLWTSAAATLLHVVTIPPRGQVMPRARTALALALGVAALAVAGGLAFGGSGTASAPVGREVALHAVRCLSVGLVVAIAPVVATAVAIRGAVPVATTWVAAGAGAAAGALGGLALELVCPIGERWHAGLAHGGVVALAALAVALVARRHR